MKNPNILKVSILFQLNECEAIREYLEEMAFKGWKLKYVSMYFYFEKIVPQKLCYNVEVLPKESVYDAAQWDFICNIGQIYIFVSNFEKPVPIKTDENLKLNIIIKGMLKYTFKKTFTFQK